MTPLERLRIASALCHAVPGAELRVQTDSDEMIVVSHHRAADIDPCALRRVVAASACPGQPDLSERVIDVTVGGSLVDIGGGVFAVSAGGFEQRWVASLLKPQRVADLLREVGLGAVPADAMCVRLKPDSDLGVTMIAVTTVEAQYHHALDEVAAQAAATCFVEELRCAAAVFAAAGSAHSSQRAGGAA